VLPDERDLDKLCQLVPLFPDLAADELSCEAIWPALLALRCGQTDKRGQSRRSALEIEPPLEKIPGDTSGRAKSNFTPGWELIGLVDRLGSRFAGM
jgi:hypothetical protein